MNNNLPISLHQRKVARKTKPAKNKNVKPIKVVYISNPMKFKASASQFRALVQELTGQDAEFPDPTKFLGTDNDVGGDKNVLDQVTKAGSDDNYSPEASVHVALGQEQTESSGCQFDPGDDDDVFTPLQMIVNLSAAEVLPSSRFHKSPQVDVV